MDSKYNLKNLLSKLTRKIKEEKNLEHRKEIMSLLKEIEKTLEVCLSFEKDYREIANHFYDALYVSNGEGKTLFVNDAYSRITGIPKIEVIGKNVNELEGFVYKGSVTPKVIESGKTQTSLGNSLINGKDLLVTGVPIFNDKGKIKYVVVNNRDISDLRKMQEELSAINKEFEITKQRLNYIKEREDVVWSVIKKSPYEKGITDLLDNLSNIDFPLLIQGEIGTGKERIANYIHNQSNRRDGELISVLCDNNMNFSDIAEKNKHKMSILELADKGTLYLKNVENLNIDFQNELSDFLEKKDGKYFYKDKAYDIRFIFSSRENLDERQEEGLLSLKLLQQISVLTVNTKPLRNRKKDIKWLTEAFLKVFNEKYDKKIELDREIINIFYKYCWPGNVRELANLIERLVIISDRKIRIEDVKSLISNNALDIEYQPVQDLKSMIEEYEKSIIIKAIAKYGNVNRAAKHLGLSQPALWNKCKKMGIKY